MSTFVLVVPLLFGQAAAPPSVDAKLVRAAIERGLQRLETAARTYPKNRQCFSCHHQALPMMAMQAARERGFAVDARLLQEQVQFTLKSFASKKGLEKGQNVGGASTTVGYALTALAAAHQPADSTVEAMTQFLLARQNPNGSWTAQAKRPPSEGSPFTSTALALYGLQHYLPKSADSELLKRIEEARNRGRDWLLGNSPENGEDRVFHLHGLVGAAVAAEEIDRARDRLLATQQADGSWAQLDDMKGDAYATGSVLVALQKSGLQATHPAYVRGIQYLLTTQKDDGSWFVQTRSRPIQAFFDNGDPGGASQFICVQATGWAVLALLETVSRDAPSGR